MVENWILQPALKVPLMLNLTPVNADAFAQAANGTPTATYGYIVVGLPVA